MADTVDFRSLSKLSPGEESSVNEAMITLRAVFYSLTPIKNKANLTLQGFEKLASRAAISGSPEEIRTVWEYRNSLGGF